MSQHLHAGAMHVVLDLQLVSRVRPLWEEHGVSTILVVGGAGDYFDVADSVVMMDS